MAGVNGTPTAIQSGIAGGNYDSSWYGSVNDPYIKPDIYKTLVEKYNKVPNIFDLMRINQYVVNVKNPTYYVFEKGSLFNKIVVATQAQLSAAGAAVITLTSGLLKVGDTILIPKSYTNGTAVDEELRVKAISGADITVESPNSALTIASGTLNGKSLFVNGTAFARGGDQPTGETNIDFKRTYELGIHKRSVTWIGGYSATDTFVMDLGNGKGKLFDRSLFETEFKFDEDMAEIILTSTPVTNTNMVDTSGVAGSKPIKKTKGILPWLAEAGQTHTWDGSTFDASNFYNLKQLMESQMASTGSATFIMGAALKYKIESSLASNVMANASRGTDLFKDGKSLGFNIQQVNLNGITYALVEANAFTNPVKYGLSGYDYSNLGIVLPMGESKYANDSASTETVKANNFSIMYLNNNGEDRTRIIRRVDGVTGREAIAVNGIDAHNTYMLSEFGLLFLKPNQGILVKS